MAENIRTLPLFVYGTLQRGEIREACWPYPAQQVLSATARGVLYDFGPHPALMPGELEIRGELWFIPADGMVITLRVLDEIEGYRQPGQRDWYLREVISVVADDGRSWEAYSYFYARPEELTESMRVEPDEAGVCHWRRAK